MSEESFYRINTVIMRKLLKLCLRQLILSW